jgi:poly-gamma-glutamate synthesis protein (capsule biosynthesis protein)
MRAGATKRLLSLALAALLLAGCFARDGTRAPTAPAVVSPPTVEVPLPTAAPVVDSGLPTNTPAIFPTVQPVIPATLPAAIRMWSALNVPVELQSAFDSLVSASSVIWVGQSDAQVSISTLPRGQTAILTSRWVYVPAVFFGAVADSVSLLDLQRYWLGDTAALAPLTSTGQVPTLVTTAPILLYLTGLFGPASPLVPIQTVSSDDAIAPTITTLGAAWGVVPFHKLSPSLKALKLDGVDVLQAALPIEQWPLYEDFGLTGDPALVNQAAAAVSAIGAWPNTNRDPALFTSLMLTGVTALTRSTAWKMELNGVDYPAGDIAPYLAGADILHTSNEVSFAEDCPYPDPNTESLTFCSRSSYFQLLQTIGLDVVELTGNHVNDWGTEAMDQSLDAYDLAGITHFGGGRDTDDARQGRILEHHGNRIAFVGCNPVGPPYAWADAEKPGAARCDEAYLATEIARLRAEADVVVMTIQYQEYYEYAAPAVQQEFFRRFVELGADVVIGSQAHQPQAFEFYNGAFIHYGLGNLFFDQMWSLATRQLFVDNLIIYDGRHISTQLYTGLIEDYARPRAMNDTERTTFLSAVFTASGW